MLSLILNKLLRVEGVMSEEYGNRKTTALKSGVQGQFIVQGAMFTCSSRVRLN